MRVCCRTCAKAMAGLAPISPGSSRSLKNERGITESGFGFRGFRYTFVAGLSRKRVGLEEIAPITGHVRNEYVLRDAYIDTVLPAKMVETLAKFAPGSLLPYTPGQFRQAFPKAEINCPPSKKAKQGGAKAARRSASHKLKSRERQMPFNSDIYTPGLK